MTLTTGEQLKFPSIELTKLEDIVQMMKSSDEGLTMLKNGSAAGTKAIKETAESGLSETANEYKILSQEIESLSELTRRIRRFLEIK